MISELVDQNQVIREIDPCILFSDQRDYKKGDQIDNMNRQE